MTIKTQLSWPIRTIFAAVVIGLGSGVAMWTYDMGRSLTRFGARDEKQELIRYKAEIEKLNAERDQFSSTVNSAESQILIERSAQRQLVLQVKALEDENVRLKEDLAFFESLLPNATSISGLAIRRLKVDLIAPSQLRYRLLVMQGGKGSRNFAGNLQLAVTVIQGGKNAMMFFPEASSSEFGKFKLDFTHYQRVEGVLTFPEGTLIKTVQARVFEKGQVRAQQTANL
jgi:hypothetical protein